MARIIKIIIRQFISITSFYCALGVLLLIASAATVAKGIRRAQRRRKDVVYLPWFWRPILFVIRCVPEPIFKRLSL